MGIWAISGTLEASRKLSLQEIHSTMDEMLRYHVEERKINAVILKRAFRCFFEHFDPQRIYLLEKEVTPYLKMSEADLQEALARYSRGDFSDFEKLHDLINDSIVRAREARKDVAMSYLLQMEIEEVPVGESYLAYAQNLEILKSRFRRLIFRQWNQGVKWPSKKYKSLFEKRQRIFNLWDQKFLKQEGTYPFKNNRETFDHSLSLHILKALAKSLDAHSNYYSPEEAEEMRSSLEKEFEGVGILLKEHLDGIEIASVVALSPAERSGNVQAGDFLMAIDGVSIEEMSYDQVLDMLKKSNKVVKLTIGKEEESFEVALTKERITLHSERVQAFLEPFGDGLICKIHLPSFYESNKQSSCAIDLREALTQAEKQGKLLGVLIDMRRNAGGFLHQAVKVAGQFIQSGVVVISRYGQGETKYLRDIEKNPVYAGPLILLTSKASASAAEIVAGALQDYGRAIIVGDERTYGKGSIQFQNVTDPKAKHFFKVTVGKYYTVSGKSTQIEGVKADVVVPTEFARYEIGEEFLEYPLRNDRVAEAYVDVLGDLDVQAKQWFQKNYLPHLQKKIEEWHDHLPILKSNSFIRLQKGKGKYDPRSIKTPHTHHPHSGCCIDRPLDEATEILKDLILLGSEKEAS